MHLVQLLLPLRDNGGKPFDRALYDGVRETLTQRFGGLTAYNRAPAEGLFSDDRGHVMRDDVVIIEVMCDALDDAFWREYRTQLTARFDQEELVIRVLPMQRL
jgi:hypothetical protein